MASKTWIAVAVFLALLSILQVEGGYWVSSDPSSKTIDDIINEEWNRLVASGKYNIQSNDKRQVPERNTHDHDHKECAAEKWMQKKYEQLKSIKVTDDGKQDTEALNSTTHSNHKRAGQTMRFYVDNTVLTSGTDPQACYTVGANILIGGTTSYTCTSQDLLTQGLIDLINNSLMPTMLSIFSQVLSVKSAQVLNPLKLDSAVWTAFGQECDTNVPIPSSYVNTGLSNTDYIIFVTARPTASSSTVAYAGGCNFHQISSGRYSRPYAGILNLNPRYFIGYVTSMTLFKYKAALKTAMHEVTHALGFSSYFYNSYLDNTTSTFYTTSPWFQYNTTGTSPAGNAYLQTIQKLRSPNVLRFARDYYNCATLDGVELEEYGGGGTAGSHWDRRVTGEEYMTGFVSDQMWMSGFTLSLFADMGWYDVDRTKVEYLGWAKDQGCAFVQNRCESSWPSADPGYWCTSTTAVAGCTADRVATGYCQLVSGTLSAYYQHFSNPSYGGIDSAADSCPYTYPYVSCRDTTQSPKTSYFEVYGESSRCWEVQGSSGTTLVCYPYQCITNNTVLQVQINSQWVTCPTAGGTVSVSSILGGTTTVNCPKTSLFCRVVDGFQPQVLITDAMLASPGATSPSSTPSVTPSRTPSISVTPSVTPTRTPSVTPSRTPSVSVTPSRTPSVTPSSSPSISTSPSVTPTRTPSPSISVSPTSSPSTGASQSTTPSRTPSISVSPSGTPSRTPTPSISVSPSSSPSAGASQSSTPSTTPSTSPSTSPGSPPSSSSSPGSAPSSSSSPVSSQPSQTPSTSPGSKHGGHKLLEGNNIIIIGAAGGGAILLLTGVALACVLIRRKNSYKPSYYHDSGMYSSEGISPNSGAAATDVPLQTVPVMATSDIQRNLMSQPGQSGPPPVPANPKPPVPKHGLPKPPPGANPFPVGSQVMAQYTGDGQFYNAVVVDFNPAKGYLVRYPEYGNEEWRPASALKK